MPTLQERIAALQLRPEEAQSAGLDSSLGGRISALNLTPQASAAYSLLGDFLSQPEVEPTGQEGFLAGIGNAAQNLPFSLGQRAREFEQVVRDPIGTATQAFNLINGIGENIPGGFGSDQSDDAKLARAAGGQLLDDFSSKGLQRDPTAALSTAASVLAPGLKVGGLGKLSKAANVAADIPTALLQGIGSAVKPLRKGADRITPSLSSLGKESFDAGLEGGQAQQQFKRGRNLTEDDPTRLGRETIEGLQGERKRLGGEVGDAVSDLGDTPIDASGIMGEVDAVLEEFGVRNLDFSRSPFDEAAQGTLLKAIQNITDLGDAPVVGDAVSARRRVDQITGSVPRDNSTLQKALGDINNTLRPHINSVGPIGKANNAFEKFAKFSDEVVNDQIGINVNPARQTTGSTLAGNKLLGIFGTNKGPAMNAVRQIEQITGQNIRAMAAGAARNTGSDSIIQRGLQGRGGGLMSTAVAAILSPRNRSLAANSAGRAVSIQQQLVAPVIALLKAMPSGALPTTITFGELIQRVSEEEE